MRWFIIFLLLCLVKANMYIRIDPYQVNSRISQFLTFHRIDNCFERLLGDNELYLKCFRDNKLIDVSVIIDESIYI